MGHEPIVGQVDGLRRSQPLVLVAIDGFGGAGKSTLAENLARHLRDGETRVTMVHMDDFAFPTSERPAGLGAEKPAGGDFDWMRLLNEVLVPLRAGRTAAYARYDWPSDEHAETIEVHPSGVVLIEGVSVCRKELSGLYDVRIWVECSRSVRLKRGIDRDGEAARWRWEEDWMPAEQHYAKTHSPAARADFRVRGDAG